MSFRTKNGSEVKNSLDGLNRTSTLLRKELVNLNTEQGKDENHNKEKEEKEKNRTKQK